MLACAGSRQKPPRSPLGICSTSLEESPVRNYLALGALDGRTTIATRVLGESIGGSPRGPSGTQTSS